MKKMWIIIVVVVLILVGGFLGKNKLKSMFGISATQNTTATEMKAVPTTATATTGTANSAMAPTDNIYKVQTDPKKGKYMTDFQGMTLYTFDKDTSGVSNCYDKCAVAWPVYTSGATAQKTFPENISVINRKDGTKQFAWKGMPLYYYVTDKQAGDITGDGVGGVWHIVKF